MKRYAMNRKLNFAYASLPWLLASLIGCGESRPEGLPALFPASVTIEQDGKPLSDATVTLVPTDPALARWPVGGQTDATGTANLKTYMQYEGAPAGSFKVTVNKNITKGDPLPAHP